MRKHITHLQKPAIIFVISDFNQRAREITDFIAKLNSTCCEVVALQLTCDDEINFNYRGAIRFKDLETDEEVLVSAARTRAVYQANYSRYQQQLDETLARLNITCQRFNIDQPLDQVLFEYLRQRHRVRR